MDHYADAQMHASSLHGAVGASTNRHRSVRGSGTRMLGVDDSMHSSSGEMPQGEMLLPQMSIDNSKHLALRFKEQRDRSMQVLWIEVLKPSHWFPKNKSKASVLGSAAMRLMRSSFPIIGWLPKMTWSTLRADVLAGLDYRCAHEPSAAAARRRALSTRRAH